MTTTETRFTAPLNEALRYIKVFEDLDDEQRTWLAERMEESVAEAGEELFAVGQEADRMISLIAGEIQILRPDTKEPFLYVHEGEVSGLLPYSRMTVLRASARVSRRCRIAWLHKRHFGDLLRDLPSVGERLVWMMADRIREFAVNETHREKLMALGKL